MARSGTLTVRVIGDTKDFKSKLDGATSKVGQFAKAAAAAGAAAAVAFGVKSVQSASRLEQSAGAVQSVFGDAAGTIEEFGKKAAESFGLSRAEVNETAATMGAQLQSMGFGADDAADQVISLQERAADMAATFGGTTTDALDAVASLMRGERDPIEKYGVAIKQADVNARLAAEGLDGLEGEAKKQAEAQAGLDLLFEQTANSAGQFASESDTLAGRQARLAAKFENVKATVGERLMPAVLGAFDAFEQFGEAARNVGSDISSRLAPVFAPVAARISELTEGEYGLVDAFKTGVEHHGEVFEDMNTMEALLSRVGGVFADFRDTVEEVFSNVAAAVRRFIDSFRTWVSNNEQTIASWQAKIDRIVGKIAPLFRSAFDAVKAVVQSALTIISAFWDRFGTHIMDFAARVFGRILNIVSEAFDVLTGIFDVVAGILTGDWSRAWEGIKEIVGSALEIVQNVIANKIDLIKTGFGAAVAVISQLWSGLWAGIKGTVFAVVNSVIGAVEGMVNDIISGVNTAIRAFNKISPRDISEVARVVFGRVGSGTSATADPGSRGGGGGGVMALAKGGIVTRPTLAMIGEGRYDEAVIPLDGRHRMGGDVYNITVNAPNYVGDHSELARAVKDVLANNKRRNGSPLAGI